MPSSKRSNPRKTRTDPPKEKWARNAVNPEHKGELREYVQMHYGKYGFTEEGTIKKEVLQELSHSEKEHIRHEAQFALNINEKESQRLLGNRFSTLSW